MRITLISKESELGTTEKFWGVKSKNEYEIGITFNIKNMLSILQIIAYYKELNKINIRLEDIIEWFFKTYLTEEFGIQNYFVKMPSKDSTYFEKCKSILPEIDYILKQFNLLVEDGIIDQELLEVSSTSILFESEGKYNYNAFLLADENNVSIKLVKYLGTNKMDLVENQEYGYRCIITATQRILDRLDAENTVYAKIEYKGRKEVEMIDKAAFKEAVINAVVHNDYSYGNSPIVELYSDRIEITSAGGLPQELSQEEFLEGVTAPRNKELIRVFKDVDLIENIGSGVLRILDAYDKSCFKFMDHFLRVSFKYRENPFEYDDTAKVKSSKLGSKKSSKLAVSEKQILELCKTAKSLKEIAQHFGYKDVYKFKNNYMNSLLEQNKLQMTIPDKPKSRNQKYVSKS